MAIQPGPDPAEGEGESLPVLTFREVKAMCFLLGKAADVGIEYIVLAAIILIVIGAAVWQLATSIANRFVAFNNRL